VPQKILAVLALGTLFSFSMLFGQVKPLNNAGTAPAPPETVSAPKTPSSLAPDTTGLPIDPNSYVIGPEDILAVKVWRENDLTGAKGVRPDGKITMPLIGDIQAAGLTPARLTEQLKDALKTQLNDPVVEVEVIQVNSKKYTITGGVNRPGPYPLVTVKTVFDAINDAGGFRDFANKSNITIIRGDGTRLKFNYSKYVKGDKDKNNVNVPLKNGDTIYIKE
jgi:polysaccharide biosynthesis/export protein